MQGCCFSIEIMLIVHGITEGILKGFPCRIKLVGGKRSTPFPKRVLLYLFHLLFNVSSQKCSPSLVYFSKCGVFSVQSSWEMLKLARGFTHEEEDGGKKHSGLSDMTND